MLEPHRPNLLSSMSKPVSRWGVAFTVSDGQFGTRYTSKFGSKLSVLKLSSIVDNVLKSCALDIQIQPRSIGSIVCNALPSTHPRSGPSTSRSKSRWQPYLPFKEFTLQIFLLVNPKGLPSFSVAPRRRPYHQSLCRSISQEIAIAIS
jgi:hypothetical protein